MLSRDDTRSEKILRKTRRKIFRGKRIYRFKLVSRHRAVKTQSNRFLDRGFSRDYGHKIVQNKPRSTIGRSISYEAQFKHALIQMETGRKTADSPVLREKPAISPRNVSDSERTRPRIYKINLSRDTKQVFGRKLPQKSPGIHPVRKSEASY